MHSNVWTLFGAGVCSNERRASFSILIFVSPYRQGSVCYYILHGNTTVIIVRVIFYYHSSVSYGDRYWLFQNDFLKRKNNVWHLIFPDRVLSVSRRVIVLNRIAWSKTAGYLFHNLIRVKGFHYFDFVRFLGRLTGRLTSSLSCQNVHWLGFLCWYWILTYIFCFTFTFRR